MDDRLQELHNQAAANCLAVIGTTPASDIQEAARLFLAAAGEIGPYDSYNVFPAEAYAVLDKAEAQFGPDGRRSLLRYVLLRTTMATLESARFSALPSTVSLEHTAQLARIVADIDTSAVWLNLSSDLFRKEFGLASLRLYAAGAQLVDFRCGVPRSIVWRGGARNIPRTWGALIRAGGFRPYFQIHTHDFMLNAFNSAGWDTCYICCAELYSVHPEVRGMFGSSWFYDPQLDTVSPRLSYLRQVPRTGGAHLFLWERGGQALNNALSTSPTRRKMYEEGSYFPAAYMLMWPRKQQIAWAKAYAARQRE